MKLITTLTKDNIANIKAVCFDCDGVTVKEGTKIVEDGNRLTIETFALSDVIAEKLNKLKHYFTLIFSSGRSLLHLTRIYEKILWDRVILQGEMGILTLVNGEVIQQKPFSLSFLEKNNQIKKAIKDLRKTDGNILGFEPKQFLITVHCREQDRKVEELIQKLDKEKEYLFPWSGEAYDIVPKGFNKGSGLKFLTERIFNAVQLENIMTVGNDPNDKEMITKSGISITTNSETMPFAQFKTIKKQELGGEEVIETLLKLAM